MNLGFFDPSTWVKEEREHRIYGDDYECLYAIVDEIDWQYFTQWRWKPYKSRTHKGTKKPKIYLGRAVPEIIGKDTYENGKRTQNRIVRTQWLHIAIMEHAGIVRPKGGDIIVDHANSNGLDCRRQNLRYATRSFNSRNINGSLEYVLSL